MILPLAIMTGCAATPWIPPSARCLLSSRRFLQPLAHAQASTALFQRNSDSLLSEGGSSCLTQTPRKSLAASLRRNSGSLFSKGSSCLIQTHVKSLTAPLQRNSGSLLSKGSPCLTHTHMKALLHPPHLSIRYIHVCHRRRMVRATVDHTPERSCWVALPPGLCNSLYDSRAALPVLLRVTCLDVAGAYAYMVPRVSQGPHLVLT